MSKKRRTKKEYVQGVYVPINKGKCLNKVCSYRSSWELRLMEWCDRSTNVVRWSSEKIEIPYVSPLDGKSHRYFPDAYIEIRGNEGTVDKFIIEVKPAGQTVPPVASKRKKEKTILYEQSMWIVNQAKWAACKTWCTRRGLKFLLVTEKHLGLA